VVTNEKVMPALDDRHPEDRKATVSKIVYKKSSLKSKELGRPKARVCRHSEAGRVR